MQALTEDPQRFGGLRDVIAAVLQGLDKDLPLVVIHQSLETLLGEVDGREGRWIILALQQVGRQPPITLSKV